jgi:NDP-sugar pyrophosphorylase family protein
MLAGIREVLIITTPEDQAGFQHLLGDGRPFGIELTYAVQLSPDGLAQAFLIGEDFICNGNVALVLGDNIFFGQHFSEKFKQASSLDKDATVFGYHVLILSGLVWWPSMRRVKPLVFKKKQRTLSRPMRSRGCIFTIMMWLILRRR